VPLTPGARVGTTIRELKTGKQFKRTKKRLGKKRAQKQALAIALKEARVPAKSPKRHRR